MNTVKLKIGAVVVFFISIVSGAKAAENFQINQAFGKISLHEDYVDNMNRSWRIDIGSPNTITLNYTTSIERNYDYIYIYEVGMDGVVSNTPIAILNEFQTGSLTTTIASGAVVVKFVSDYSVCYGYGYEGFDIEFMSSNTSVSNKNMLVREDLSVGKNLFVQGRLGIGTANPDEKMTVVGDVVAEEIIVDLAVPADYVFDSDYRLSPLKEVEKYIEKNGHLPEIKSAAEIKEEGLKIGEMQNKLLQKIEELTLYVIQQQKRINELKLKVSASSKKR